MKNIYSLLLLILSFAFTIPLQAREFVGNNNKSVKQLKATAEACSQATGFQFLNVNNVRARIHTGGDMWWDLVNGTGSRPLIFYTQRRYSYFYVLQVRLVDRRARY
jgi:hypothetical protein